MPLSLTGLTLMLAGPSDTVDDIAVAIEVINRWNDQHARDQGVVYLPVHYMHNVVPVYQRGVDGQLIINEQITIDSDLAICLFRHRLGSATPRNDLSASVEEADVVSARGRAHILFWNGDLPRGILDDPKAEAQRKGLNAFRKSFESIEDPKGLYGTFSSENELRGTVEQILWQHARKHPAPKDTFSPSQTDLVVQVQGPVWRMGDLRGVIEKVAASTTRAMSADSAKRYTADCHARAEELEEVIAANAGYPLAVDVRTTSTKITDLEIEFEFPETLGVDPANDTWADVWRISRPNSTVYPMYDASAIHVRGTMATWPARASWNYADDKDDVLLTVTVEDLRRSRAATRVGDEVVLWRVSDDAAATVDYIWHASGTVGSDIVEWSGRGTIDVISQEEAIRRLLRWAEGHSNDPDEADDVGEKVTP